MAGHHSIDGSPHRILIEPSSKRLRIASAKRVVADTVAGQRLHGTGLLPVLYLAREDIRGDLRAPSSRRMTCPFEKEASFWSVRTGDRVEQDIASSYEDPLPEALGRQDHLSFAGDGVTVDVG